MGNPRSLEPAHFGGSSLQQMHSWVHAGPGANAMHATSELWTQEQKYMKELATRVRDRMAQAKVVIESQSGEAMQNAVAPVVLWSEVTADNALTQAQRLQEQGEAFSKVQAAVPSPSEMKPVPSDNWFEKTWSSITGSKTDAQIAQAHNEQLRQEAITAFNGYQSTSQSSVSGTPIFTAPPPAAVDTSVQSNGGGPGVGGFASPGGAGGGGVAGGGVSGGAVHSGGGGSAALGGSLGAPGSGGFAGPSSGTHAAGYSPAPSTPSFHGTLPSAGGSAGTGAGLGGAVGGIGAAGGALGGGLAGSGGRVGAGGRAGGSTASGGRAGSSGAASGEEEEGRAGSSGRSGSLAAEEESAAGRGANRGAGTAGGAGRGAGRRGAEDEEHYSPEFLKDDHGFFDEDVPPVAPPVFGD